MSWQPIETAPKGIRIILYLPRIDGVVIGHWHQPGNPECQGFWVGDGLLHKKNPTHWMPLPKPPNEKPQTGGT